MRNQKDENFQAAAKEKVIVKSITTMVPSGAIKEVTRAGTITLEQRVYFLRRRNLNRVIGRKTQIVTMQAVDNDHRHQNRPGSPTCGDPEAAGAVGRMETRRNRRDT